MAGPSVLVRVLGDVSGLSKSFKDSGTAAESASGKARAAFSNMLGMINRTGALGPFGEALSIADEAMQNLAEHGKKVSDVMLGAGAGLVAVGGLATSLGSKEKAAHQQLAAAIDNTGQSYATYGKQIDEAIKHEEKYGNSSVQTQNALQALTQATHNPAEALKLLSTATDVAAAKHEDLTTAATAVGKVYNGNTKLLKEYGIVLDKHTHLTADGKTATQALADVTKGQAAAASDTFNGKIKALSTTIEDHVSLLGEKYGPALTGIGAAMTGLGTVMKIGQAAMEAFKGAQEAATVATDAQTAAEDAAAVSEGLALGPILLIVAAAALLAAGIYELAKHWSAVWAGIKAVVADVWNWIQKNWPLLLGILMGPIGLAIAWIVQHWAAVKQAFVDAFQWLQRNWPLILAILTGPIGIAVYTIQQNWGTIVGFFSGIISQIGSVFAGVINVIVAPFKWAFNSIADLWNNTVGSLSFKIPGWVPGVGGKGFDMPKIPHMAQGGLITQTGLIFAHAGEAIIPAPAGTARQGAAVHIENATFSTEMDVDLFMRKAAWVARTQRV